MKENYQRLEIIFPIAIGVLLVFLAYYALTPAATDYPFDTVKKVEGIYDEPVYLLFHWKTEDELMVGKEVTVSVGVIDLPYNYTQSSKEIKIKFDGLSYFNDYFDSEKEKIRKVDTLILKKDTTEENVFGSDRITIRYLTPLSHGIWYCDYNISDECKYIENIIEPAPHSLFVQLDVAHTNVSLTIAILILTTVIIWLMIRQEIIRKKKYEI